VRLANALFAALALLAAAADGSAGQVQPIEAAQFRLSAETRPPADETGWDRVALPDHPAQRLPGARGIAWYRFSFELAEPGDAPLLLYMRRLVQGGRIWVNGEPLAAVQESSDEQRVLWLRPFAFPIPPALLRAGTNTVHVRVDVRSDEITLGMTYVGPDAQVRPRFDARFFWTHTSANVSIVVTTVTALFVVGIWLRRRLGIEYG
jgi:hypothetical protein